MATYDRKNLCSGCGYNFLSMDVFDRHRIDDPQATKTHGRRCLTPEEMTVKGMHCRSGALPRYDDGKIVADIPVTSWYIPLSEKNKEQLRQLNARNKAAQERVK